MKLQIALDFISLDDAINIAKKVAPYCDILEAGTPLIKSEGSRTVQTLKQLFPEKQIFADLKTIDASDIEVSVFAKSGADFIAVLACSCDSTIRKSLITAKNNNCHIVFDLLGTEEKLKRAIELEKMGAEYIHVHCGLDEQSEGKNPLAHLQDIGSKLQTKVTVGGGINISNIIDYLKISNLEIIIIGASITKAADPAKEAQIIYKLIKSI